MFSKNSEKKMKKSFKHRFLLISVHNTKLSTNILPYCQIRVSACYQCDHSRSNRCHSLYISFALQQHNTSHHHMSAWLTAIHDVICCLFLLYLIFHLPLTPQYLSIIFYLPQNLSLDLASKADYYI